MAISEFGVRCSTYLKLGHFGYVMEGGQVKLSGSTQDLMNDERVNILILEKRSDPGGIGKGNCFWRRMF